MFRLKPWMWSVSLSVLTTLVASENYVVCYYGSWATYRAVPQKFDVSDINPDLCTHVIYSFAGLDKKGAIKPLDPYLDLPDNGGRNNYGAFTALKKKNPQLKTILAVGGWNEGSAKFSTMASSPASRNIFIDSAVSMLQKHGFDGLDLDWEYPNRRDSVHGSADIDNFSLLVKELKEVFDKHRYFLSAAVSCVRDMAAQSYDIPAIAKYLDLIHIMTYDMHGSWDPVTGHNAPLHKSLTDTGNVEDLYTVDMALKYWISQGASPKKLALGIPTYGRSFKLTDPKNNSVGAPASGPGPGVDGSIGYAEFCSKLKTEPWTTKYDSTAEVPYAYNGDSWVSYDDPDSVAKKVQFAKTLGITSVFTWSLETDDFRNLCGGGTYPLLRAMNTALKNNGNQTVTSKPSYTVSTTKATTTSLASSKPTAGVSSSTAPSGSTEVSSICTESGPTRNPRDCTSFYICVTKGNGDLDPVKMQCPKSLHYDMSLKACNYANAANCKV